MSQTSDNSRTFRVLNLTDEVKTKLSEVNAVVSQHESVNYVEVVDVASIAGVKKVLDENEMKYKQCSYSTFVRFKDELTVEQLTKLVNDLCANVNVLYVRVDENNHTGKLVVDKLNDYNTLKGNTGDVSFYRFSPLNVPRVQNRNYAGNSRPEGEWQQVPARNTNSVRGRYANAVTGNSAPRGDGARGVDGGAPRGAGRGGGFGRGAGRGGASRGVGRGGNSNVASSS
jgi:hypothetical protein